MKVVLVSRFPSNIDQPRGGVETATVGLARALLSLGINDLHVVTLEAGLKKNILEDHLGIKIHRLPRSKWPMFLDVFGGPSIIRLRNYLHQLKPSVVHFQETWGFSAPTCGFPTVFTVHGFDSLNLPTEKAPNWRLRSIAWQWAEKKGLRDQTHLISIAPYVHQEMAQKTNAKITDIWNSLDVSYYDLERSDDGRSLLFLGWLNQRKNPLVIVKAAALLLSKFPDLKVNLCGEAVDPAYHQQLKSLISQLNLQNVVNLPGMLPQSSVKDYLKSTAILVLPSFQENAPMVISEAMAAGVPVIASNLCGIPDMIENGRSGILLDDPTDPTELATAIESLLSNVERRQEIGNQAKLTANRLFHPENVAKATLAVYSEVIAEYQKAHKSS